MNDLVERVAKAMVARRALPANAVVNWEAFRADARSAIDAMREPTEQMLEELDLANCGWGTRERSVELWQSLIELALK